MTRQQATGVAPDHRHLRDAFGTFATGVTVVTVTGGTPHGMTANSLATVSLEPPLLLVCVRKEAVMHRLVDAAGEFGVSVLSAGQETIARYFADSARPAGGKQFEAIGWRPGQITGAPLLTGTLAWFECALWRTYDGGDHSIFVGRLLSLDSRLDGDALVFLGGQFRRLGRGPEGRLPGCQAASHPIRVS